MTITYTAEVATCTKFGCFLKLLLRWKGSIYKLVWMDLILFLSLYYGINMIYRYLLNQESQSTFESVVIYCATNSSLIPLSFVLGFYVNLVMARWWEQYTTIPWPDSIAVFVSAHVHGQDEGGRVMRRTVMRYVCLCLTIVFTMISPCVKKRFPKLKNLVDAGLLLENEKKIIEKMDVAFPKCPKHWMPIVWAASIITRARNEGRIRDDFAVKTIIDELNNFRGRCGTVMYYDFISVPLVYTQVVTIAVYSFFVCSLLAHQWTKLKKDTYEGYDYSIPVFITMEFFFYMGWLKVAETLINPFGEDDDDFEVNWMIDRNLQVSYLIVDEMHLEHPELVKDQYWDEVYPAQLPYDIDSKREQPPSASTAKYDVEDTSIEPLVKKSFIGPSGLSIRSEQFKQAFQRFSQISEEELMVSKHVSGMGSLTDVESVRFVTKYRRPLSSQDLLQTNLEHIKEEGSKENSAIDEEYEMELENEEEEGDIEDEDEETEEEEEESDLEDDPFEKLRLERQQERIQRQNAFIQRFFGNNYKITSLQLNPEPEKNKRPAPTSEVPTSTRVKVLDAKQPNVEEETNLVKPSDFRTLSLESILKSLVKETPVQMEEFEQASSSIHLENEISTTTYNFDDSTSLESDFKRGVSYQSLTMGPPNSIENLRKFSASVESYLNKILNRVPTVGQKLSNNVRSSSESIDSNVNRIVGSIPIIATTSESTESSGSGASGDLSLINEASDQTIQSPEKTDVSPSMRDTPRHNLDPTSVQEPSRHLLYSSSASIEANINRIFKSSPEDGDSQSSIISVSQSDSRINRTDGGRQVVSPSDESTQRLAYSSTLFHSSDFLINDLTSPVRLIVVEKTTSCTQTPSSSDFVATSSEELITQAATSRDIGLSPMVSFASCVTATTEKESDSDAGYDDSLASGSKSSK